MTLLEGRSPTTIDRAKAAGAESLNDVSLIDQAEMLLSIVPPSSAATAAEHFLPLIERAKNKPIYIDCNAVAPQTLHAISRPFLQRALPFGDASIIGLPPKPDGYSPRLYMSGRISAHAATLKQFGLDTRMISDALGDASALKMAYAGITKGFQAIGVSMALGAARTGAADSLVAELQDSQPALYTWLCKMIPRMYAKAYRWDDEMREIAKFLEPERGAADMLLGAATLYRHVAEDNRSGAQSEIISILDRFALAHKGHS